GGIAAGQVADLIDALVAKSILLREGQETARYRLLDTIGEFGLAKVHGRDRERELRRRHRAWDAALAARQDAVGAGRAGGGAGAAGGTAARDADQETRGAARRFCLPDRGEAPAGAELACDLWRYWETGGHLTEGRRILATLLERLQHGTPVRRRALWVAGYLA